MDLASWDYTQQYPNQESSNQDEPTQDHVLQDNVDANSPDDSGEEGSGRPTFHADFDASGQLTLHITPVAQFGIVWAFAEVPDTSVGHNAEDEAFQFVSFFSKSYSGGLHRRLYHSLLCRLILV